MKSRQVVITNASGLHARPATFFIQKANCYKSTIWVEKGDRSFPRHCQGHDRDVDC